MRIAIDAQLAVGSATGIGEYVEGLIAGLRARGIEVAALREPRLDPWRFDRRLLWDQVLLPLAVARSGAQLLHCASGTMPAIMPLPVVVTVHDVAWLRAQDHARAYARSYFGLFSAARYRHARRVIVDSEFTRDELLACTRVDATQVDVVPPGVADDYFAVVRVPKASPFVLAVGTIEPRKNLELLIRVMARLGDSVRLIVVGPATPYEGRCRAIASQLNVANRIDWLGYVPRRTLLALFARAAVVAVPSRYEGFGYAAAQALCAGAPVIVSNAASLVEVVDGAAPTLDPEDVDAWVEEIRMMLADRDRSEDHARGLRSAAIARFAWPRAAAHTCEVYAKALMSDPAGH